VAVWKGTSSCPCGVYEVGGSKSKKKAGRIFEPGIGYFESVIKIVLTPFSTQSAIPNPCPPRGEYMEWTKVGIYAGVMGSLVGLLGGIVGTYYEIARRKTDEQRSAMKKLAAYAWLAVIGLVVCLMILPRPYNYLAHLLFLASFPWIVSRVSRILTADPEQSKQHS